MARLTIHQIKDSSDLHALLQQCAAWRVDPFAHLPLKNSIEHAQKAGCVTVIKQDPVQDPDYLAEYLAYYARGFLNIKKECIRLHFFSAPMKDAEDVLPYLDRISHESSDAYLGFLTLRPTLTSPVGATILSCLPSGHFVLCIDEFPVHLAGCNFSVKGTPFMQQDNAVGACAQASIWMALRTLRKKQGHSAFDPAQITTAATRFLVQGRTLPNREGLNPNQMVEAVRSAGYASHLHYFRNHNQPFSPDELEAARLWLYTYIESEIPVILGLFHSQQSSGHAVVLVGHGWSNAKVANNQLTTTFPVGTTSFLIHQAVEWVNGFYIHNDNTGPYQWLADKATGNEFSLEHTVFALPLLPGDVFLSGEEAVQTSINLYKDVAADFVANLTQGSPLPESDVVFRTYLIERHQFRSWALRSNLCSTVKDYYRLKNLPRRVWVTEINFKADYGDLAKLSTSRLGEIVLDPTGDGRDSPFLTIHINSAWTKAPDGSGLLIDRDIISQKIDVVKIQSDSRYMAYTRN